MTVELLRLRKSRQVVVGPVHFPKGAGFPHNKQKSNSAPLTEIGRQHSEIFWCIRQAEDPHSTYRRICTFGYANFGIELTVPPPQLPKRGEEEEQIPAPVLAAYNTLLHVLSMSGDEALLRREFDEKYPRLGRCTAAA